MRCTCANTRIAELVTQGALLDAMAEQEPDHAGAPYVRSTLRRAAGVLRARASAIRTEHRMPEGGRC